MEDHPEPATRHQAILRGLEALGEAHLDHPVLQRAVGSKFLPQRLRERWQALGIGNEHASNASSAEDSAETRKRLRMEAMRQRQQALMRRMQQQQSQAVAAMDEATQGALNDETEAEDTGALWQCATCREAGTPENPLAMLAAVVPWQSKSSHRGGLPGYARFTSCRHLVHVSCGLAHAEDVRNQAGRSLFFFVDAAGGEFPCPMCRSVANCLIPCVPDEEFLDSGDASWQPEVTHTVSAPSRVRPPLPALQSALRACAGRASRAEPEASPEQNEGQLDDSQGAALSVPLLRAAAAELRGAAALFPLQLMDEGPPAPLYAELFRSAALLRSGAATLAPKLEDNGWQSQVLGWLSQPREPWLLDLKAALADLVTTKLGDEDGLSQSAFAELVVLLMKVCVRQDAASKAGLHPNEEEGSPPKAVVELLLFAAWICAAIWRLPAQERNRLAYLQSEKAESVAVLATMLRLPGLATSFDIRMVPMGELPELPGSLKEGCPPSVLDEITEFPFIDLPEAYLDLIKDIRKKPCTACGKLPAEPALCLLCGAIVCLGSRACRGRNETEGQCTEHARRCASGQCLFLLPYLAQILAVSAPDCCLWDCPYVDRNGELNPNLKRPCMMHFRLDQQRLASLRQTFTKSSIRREIFLYNQRTGQYIPQAL